MKFSLRKAIGAGRRTQGTRFQITRRGGQSRHEGCASPTVRHACTRDVIPAKTRVDCDSQRQEQPVMGRSLRPWLAGRDVIPATAGIHFDSRCRRPMDECLLPQRRKEQHRRFPALASPIESFPCAAGEGTASTLSGVGVSYRILPPRSGGRCRQAEGGALRLQRCPPSGLRPPSPASGGRCRQAEGGALRLQRGPLPAFGHLPPQAGEGTASTLSGVGVSYRILPPRSGGRCRQAEGGALRLQRGPLPAFGHLPPRAGEGTASASPIEPFLRARGKERPGQPPQSMPVVPRGLTAPAGTRARHVPRAAPARNTRCGNFPSYTFPLRR